MWRAPFGITFLELFQIGLEAALNPASVEEPLSALGISAGARLVRGENGAKNISASFRVFVHVLPPEAFYIEVSLQNCTFQNIFDFVLGASLPSCFAGLDWGFKTLDLKICSGALRLANGDLLQRTFRCRGDFVLKIFALDFETFWDVQVDPSVKVVAACKKMSFCNDLIQLSEGPNAQQNLSQIPDFLGIPAQFRGGPVFVLDLATPVLAFSAALRLFALVAQIDGKLSASGVDFHVDTTVGAIFHAKIDCTLSSAGFAAGGILHVGAGFTVPEVSLCGVTLVDSIPVNIQFDAETNLWANTKSMGFNFSGQFELSLATADLQIVLPTLDVNVPFADLAADAPCTPPQLNKSLAKKKKPKTKNQTKNKKNHNKKKKKIKTRKREK